MKTKTSKQTNKEIKPVETFKINITNSLLSSNYKLDIARNGIYNIISAINTVDTPEIDKTAIELLTLSIKKIETDLDNIAKSFKNLQELKNEK